ncbi:MAG: TolC family protein, partial [Sphingobacterium paramultivorum]
NYNLFDLRRKKVKLNTQRLMVDEAGQKLQEQQANIAMNIAQSATEVATAERRLKEIPRQTKAANAAYRQKFSLYKNGLIDIVEVNVAQNMLNQAERDYITAKYNYYLALFHQVVAQNNVDGFLQLFN